MCTWMNDTKDCFRVKPHVTLYIYISIAQVRSLINFCP